MAVPCPRCSVLEKERDEARSFGEDAAAKYNELLISPLVLSCAYCGEEYPPDTPASQHDLLTAHISICEKHPMRLVERQLAALDFLYGLADTVCEAAKVYRAAEIVYCGLDDQQQDAEERARLREKRAALDRALAELGEFDDE